MADTSILEKTTPRKLPSVLNLNALCDLDRKIHAQIAELVTEPLFPVLARIVMSYHGSHLPLMPGRSANTWIRNHKWTSALIRLSCKVSQNHQFTLREYLKKGIPLWSNVNSNLDRCGALLQLGLDCIHSPRFKVLWFNMVDDQISFHDTPSNVKFFGKVSKNRTWCLSVGTGAASSKNPIMFEAPTLGEALRMYILSR